MLSRVELRRIARARLRDAEVLLAASRFDAAIYLCGYAIEIALKARICVRLGWSGYPSMNREFQDFQSFKTHKLDVLLRLSGAEKKVQTRFFSEWSAVALWQLDLRYNPIGTASKADVERMIASATVLVGVL